MKKYVLAFIIAAITSLCVSAEGEMKRYEVNVNDFSELKVLEGLNVDYKCSEDSNGYVVFNAAPDIASVIMLNNNRSGLEIQISTDGIDYDNLPRITVYSRFLNKVENDGDSLVRVLTVAPTASFRATLIGNGGLAVHGINTNNFVGAIKTGNGVIAANGKTTMLIGGDGHNRMQSGKQTYRCGHLRSKLGQSVLPWKTGNQGPCTRCENSSYRAIILCSSANNKGKPTSRQLAFFYALIK